MTIFHRTKSIEFRQPINFDPEILPKFKHADYFEVVSRNENVDLDSIENVFSAEKNYNFSRTRLKTGVERLRIERKNRESQTANTKPTNESA